MPMTAARSRLESVTGSAERFDLSRRALNATTFCAALAVGSMFVADLTLVGEPSGCLLSLAGFVAMAVLHGLGRSGRRVVGLPWAFLLVSLVLLGWVWWSLGGLVGSALSVALALAVAIPTLFDGRARWAALALLALATLAMAAVEQAAPRWIQPLAGRSLLIDTLVTALLLGAGLAGLVSLLMLAQRRERERVEAVGRELGATVAALEARNAELDAALGEIRDLEGIVPICAACKKVRNDGGYYEAVEAYLARRSGARFSHTLCPDCLPKYFGDGG